MKCPECEKLGIKSTVRHNGGLTTLLDYSPYYDEEGEYHDHDPNRNTFFMSVVKAMSLLLIVDILVLILNAITVRNNIYWG